MKLQLETPRLLLRPFVLDDASNLFKMDANPNVHRYLWQKPTTHIEESIKIIEYIHTQYAENNIGRFATILKETNEFIGWTGIKWINDHIENGNTNFYDYGYRLAEPFWGKGYASEATAAWFDYGFSEMKIQRMHAYTHAENTASNHILSKFGMQLVEHYLTEDGVTWNWWKKENPVIHA